MDATTRFIDLHEILLNNKRGRSKQYNLVSAGLYPPPIRHGRSSFWLASEDEAIRRAIISGKTEDEIRKIVRELEDARKLAYTQPTHSTSEHAQALTA